MPTPRTHRPPAASEPVAAQPIYIETCNVNFSAPPTTKRATPKAQQLVFSGARLEQTASATPQPQTPAQAQATVSAIELYRKALLEDPYNAEATLRLALAYDSMLRKGCAIALLKRLDQLTDHPGLAKEAEPQVSLVEANSHWFRGYRNEALKAAGL